MRIVLALCLLVMPFALQAQAEKGRLKVGALLPLSGELKDFGKDMDAGMRLALEDLKLSDEDISARIDLEIRDYQSAPDKTLALAKELIAARKADILIGPLTGSTTMSLYRRLEDAHRPFISATSGHSSINRLGDNVFRTCLSDSMQGKIMAHFAFQDMQRAKGAILVEEESAYGQDLATVFEQEFKLLGGQILQKVSYPPGTTDFKKYILQLKRKTPQFVFMPSSYQDAARAVEIAKAEGLKSSFLGGDGWDSSKLYTLAPKEALKGHYYLSHFSPSDTDPQVRAFVKRFVDREKREPSMYAAMGYDSMLVIADAFKHSHTSLATSILKALAGVRDVKSLMGPLSMTTQRDALKGAAILATSPEGPKWKTKITMAAPEISSAP